MWLWNADKGILLNTFSGHGSSVTCGTFTPDGTWLLLQMMMSGLFFVNICSGS